MATAKQRAQWKKWQAAGAAKRKGKTPGSGGMYTLVHKGGTVGKSFTKKSNAKRYAKKFGAVGIVMHKSSDAFKRLR